MHDVLLGLAEGKAADQAVPPQTLRRGMGAGDTFPPDMAGGGEKQMDGDGEMISRIEEFRLRFDAMNDAYVAQASAALNGFTRQMIDMQAEFEADMKADPDLYDAVSNGCLKTLERKIKEAGL